MRSTLKIALATLGGLTLISSANATLRLDQGVSQGVVHDTSNPTGLVKKTSLLRAYRDEGSCTSWEYMPGYLVGEVTGQSTGNGVSFINGQRLQNYITQIYGRANVNATNADIDQLTHLIAAKLDGIPECKDKGVKASDIKLSAVQILLDRSFRTRSIESRDDSDGADEAALGSSSGVYEQVNIPMPKDPPAQKDAPAEKGVSRNSFMQVDFSYILDATDARTEGFVHDKIAASQTGLSAITQLVYKIPGIAAKVDSHLTFTGEWTATFSSKIHDMGCTSSDSSSFLFTGTPFAYNNQSVKCSSQLLTTLMNTTFKQNLEYKHNFPMTDDDGDPIMIDVYDEKGKSVPMTLRDYVQKMLFMQFVLSNFKVTFDNVQKAFFEPTLGKDGLAVLTVNADNAFLMSFKGTTRVMVPIMGKNLDATKFHFEYTQGNDYKCMVANYSDQQKLYPVTGNSPIPSNRVCPGGAK